MEVTVLKTAGKVELDAEYVSAISDRQSAARRLEQQSR